MNGTIELLRGLGLDGSWHNFVFLGEAGSGKSEIAISFAKALARTETRPWPRRTPAPSTSSTWT